MNPGGCLPKLVPNIQKPEKVTMPTDRSTEQDLRVPSLDELLPDDDALVQLHEQAAEALEKIVPQSDDQRLAAWLFVHPPDPLSGSVSGVWCWFHLMKVLAAQSEGYTAKQLARRLGLDHRLPRLAWLLERLAERGELRKTNKGAVRYQSKPLNKVLCHLLRQFHRRLPEAERDAFDLAVLAYQETATHEGWQEVVEALVVLLKVIPGWPEAIAETAAADPGDWLRLLAGLEPPSYLLKEADPLVDTLRAEIDRLMAENGALKQQLEVTLKVTGEQQEEIHLLEEAQRHLEARLEELEAWLESSGTIPESEALEEFLAGRGRGVLPGDLLDEEVSHVRELVLATKANRKAMLAIAAALGDVYRNPTAQQRLTTLSFKEHPYDSLWRARVGNYRIVYGLTHNQVRPIVIGTRGEVYELAVHALRNKQL